MQKTLANPRIQRATINIMTIGLKMKGILEFRNISITYNSMQILGECLQLSRLHLRAISGIAFQSYQQLRGQTEGQQENPENTWQT